MGDFGNTVRIRFWSRNAECNFEKFNFPSRGEKEKTNDDPETIKRERERENWWYKKTLTSL